MSDNMHIFQKLSFSRRMPIYYAKTTTQDFKSVDAAGIHPNWVIVVVSIWLATLGNWALWQELTRLPEMDDLRAVWFGVSFALLIAALITVSLSVLCWRWTLKPIISVFLIAAALGGYFMLSYGVVIDSSMIVNVLQTDLRESRDLISGKMILALVVFALLPIGLLWRTKVKHLGALRQIGHSALLFVCGIALALLAVLPNYQNFASTMRNNIQLRFLINPLNSFYALGDMLLMQPPQNGVAAVLPIGLDVKLGSSYNKTQPKSPLLVLVVGETARSGNFGINGYEKETTPSLSQLQKNTDSTGSLTSFKNVWACGTSTATALPCMFSHLDRMAYQDSKENLENLVDVLQRAGMAVIWLENQSGCKGICDRIYRASTAKLTDPAFCSTGECFDEIMLHKLEERFLEFPPEKLDKGIVVIMHQMGSHGPAYYKRAPEAIKKFKPECSTNVLQDCTREQVTNAYDNTILYTDYFLNKVVKFLKDKEPHVQTAMVYVADHGESLGENNVYLHGLPYAIAPDVQKMVPWINWLSNDFLQRNRINSACLAAKKDSRLSQDNYFHSVLGLLDVKTAVYKPELDVYASCSTKLP
jgi:lipid A ethanolaminephosphotransferase